MTLSNTLRLTRLFARSLRYICHINFKCLLPSFFTGIHRNPTLFLRDVGFHCDSGDLHPLWRWMCPWSMEPRLSQVRLTQPTRLALTLAQANALSFVKRRCYFFCLWYNIKNATPWKKTIGTTAESGNHIRHIRGFIRCADSRRGRRRVGKSHPNDPVAKHDRCQPRQGLCRAERTISDVGGCAARRC